jgi:Tfp pilus assembly protein PilX
MMRHGCQSFPGRQRGYATLVVGIVMLVAVSLMAIYAARSGILDIRTSADRVRYAEALAQAESRVEQGIAWIMTNRDGLDTSAWTTASFGSCTSSTTTVPCGDGNTNRYGNTFKYRCHNSTGSIVNCSTAASSTMFYLMGQVVAAGTLQATFDVIARGTSTDSRANAVVKQGIYFYAMGNNKNVPAPFLAAGNITTGGNFNLVANPNGGGPGVPVSAWTPNNVTDIGSAASCQIQEFSVSNVCPASSALSSSTSIGLDIVRNATNFPADLFDYLFGVPAANYQAFKAMANVQKISDCSALGSSSKGIYWYSSATASTCGPSGTIGAPAGSASGGPVILVVEDQNFDYTANDTFYGIVFSFSPSTTGREVKFAGTGSIRGVVITDNLNAAGQVINGTFKLVYDASVMTAIGTDPTFMGLAKLPGSWTDFLD